MRTKQRFIIFLWLLLCVFLQKAQAAKWDFEYWQQLTLKNWEQGPYKLYTNASTRIHHDLRKFYYYRITEALAYQAFPWLSLEAHYSFVYDIPSGNTNFVNTHRLEFEMNPSLDLDNGIKLNWRNRYELQKRQNNSHLQSVFRQRSMITYPLSNHGSLKAISCSDEFFIDLNKCKCTQNRFYPITLTFAVSEKTTLDCFLMVRNFSKISTGRWFNSIVLGSELGF